MLMPLRLKYYFFLRHLGNETRTETTLYEEGNEAREREISLPLGTVQC